METKVIFIMLFLAMVLSIIKMIENEVK